MTDKRQSDSLRLADELEDSLESHDGSSLTARCQGIANDAAAELRRLHVELETLRAKLKTHEDLGDAGSDVQLLRVGYAAARLEIEPLNARPAVAPQPVEREPLPSVEIMRIVMGVEQQHNFLRGTTNWAAAVGRAIEAAHGITKRGQHG